MTEYTVLIVEPRDRWSTELTDAQRVEGYREHHRFAEELAARGHRVTASGELSPSTEARSIAAGTTRVTDGPYAETAEHVGGFFVVHTEDADDLLECCTILTALGDGVELRRVVQPEERPAT